MEDLTQNPVEQTVEPINQQSFLSKLNWKYIGIGFVVILFVGIGVFWVGTQQSYKVEIPYAPPTVPTLSLNPTQQQLVIEKLQARNQSKKYEDPIYKFQIMIPEGWNITQTHGKETGEVIPGDSLLMSSYDMGSNSKSYTQSLDNPTKVDIIISTDSKNTLSQEKDEYSKLIGEFEWGDLVTKRVSVEDYVVDNMPAIKVLYDSEARFDVITLGNNGYRYHIGYYNFNRDGKIPDSQLFEDIVSSFKFID